MRAHLALLQAQATRYAIAGEFPDELILDLVHCRLALDLFTGGQPDA